MNYIVTNFYQCERKNFFLSTSKVCYINNFVIFAILFILKFLYNPWFLCWSAAAAIHPVRSRVHIYFISYKCNAPPAHRLVAVFPFVGQCLKVGQVVYVGQNTLCTVFIFYEKNKYFAQHDKHRSSKNWVELEPDNWVIFKQTKYSLPPPLPCPPPFPPNPKFIL